MLEVEAVPQSCIPYVQMGLSIDFKSIEVGITYFDVLGTQCYKEEYPIISCKKYNS
jgi:hypothetical protein